MAQAKRHEIPRELCWDPQLLYASDEVFREAMGEQQKRIDAFCQKYQNRISQFQTAEQVLSLYEELEPLAQNFEPLFTYPSLRSDVDMHNREASRLSQEAECLLAQCYAQLSFVNSELLELDGSLLEEAAERDGRYRRSIEDLLRQKPHQLSKETERVLSALSPILNAPESNYALTRATDFHFPDIHTAQGPVANSFVGYENNFCSEDDTELRRGAFASFSEGLRHYVHCIGQDYYTQVQKEKILSQLRGYDSVLDYLLDRQEVDQELYMRQIDVTMEALAPHMRRFAKLLQRMHGLEEMHYADLKLSLDSAYSPEISIPESKRMCREALSLLGPEYMSIVDRMLDERRIDYAQNAGKSSGGYCASPYGHSSFILLNWSGKMDEVFTLAHELGHAGHFNLAMQNQNYFNSDCSMYQVEAPSTCNELFLAKYLHGQKPDDPRFRRWVLAAQIEKTYYHNFVTHFLEAAYQREVYRRIDQGDVLGAEDFSELYLEQLKRFWGDAIVYDPGCELTWMRQGHYYAGLYPYTYSAGLTIATAVMQRVEKEGQPAIDDWLRTLKAGGSLSPLDFALSAGIDIRSEQPLRDTIAYIGQIIDEIEQLCDEIGDC